MCKTVVCVKINTDKLGAIVENSGSCVRVQTEKIIRVREVPKRLRVLVRTTRILPPGLTFTSRIWLPALIMLSLPFSLPEEIINFYRVVRVDWPEIQLVALGVSLLPSSSHHFLVAHGSFIAEYCWPSAPLLNMIVRF